MGSDLPIIERLVMIRVPIAGSAETREIRAWCPGHIVRRIRPKADRRDDRAAIGIRAGVNSRSENGNGIRVLVGHIHTAVQRGECRTRHLSIGNPGYITLGDAKSKASQGDNGERRAGTAHLHASDLQGRTATAFHVIACPRTTIRRVIDTPKAPANVAEVEKWLRSDRGK